MQTTLDLPCSSSGSTSISFSFGNYNGGSVPSWIQIDSNTGVLNITTPDISQDIEFNFYIYSGMSVSSNLVQIPKLIKFKVLNCNAQNWEKCQFKSNSIWALWNSGYILHNGGWIIPTETAKGLKTTTQSIMASAAWILVVMSVFNTSSLSSLWATQK